MLSLFLSLSCRFVFVGLPDIRKDVQCPICLGTPLPWIFCFHTKNEIFFSAFELMWYFLLFINRFIKLDISVIQFCLPAFVVMSDAFKPVPDFWSLGENNWMGWNNLMRHQKFPCRTRWWYKKSVDVLMVVWYQSYICGSNEVKADILLLIMDRCNTCGWFSSKLLAHFSLTYMIGYQFCKNWTLIMPFAWTGIIKKTRTVMECLHRFCRECIDKSMRLGYLTETFTLYLYLIW